MTLRTPLAGLAAAAILAAPTAAAAPSRTVWLTIPHVAEGCHVWSHGSHRQASMTLHLRAGDRLGIVNMDIDMHRLVQRSGPHLRLGAPMGRNGRTMLVLARRGTYRLETKVEEMHRGMLGASHGGKNHLRLTLLVR